jgi:hypothetical protein
MEYLRVLFSERRKVVIDGVNSGQYTGDVIELEAGRHIVSLNGEPDFDPELGEIILEGTSVLVPKEVRFEKK